MSVNKRVLIVFHNQMFTYNSIRVLAKTMVSMGYTVDVAVMTLDDVPELTKALKGIDGVIITEYRDQLLVRKSFDEYGAHFGPSKEALKELAATVFKRKFIHYRSVCARCESATLQSYKTLSSDTDMEALLLKMGEDNMFNNKRVLWFGGTEQIIYDDTEVSSCPQC